MNTDDHLFPDVKEFLLNHTDEGTSFLIEDYPYGRKLRCQRKVWVETDPRGKRGDRFVGRTQNPKTKRWNRPKKTTYANLGFLYLDHKGHVRWATVNIYSKKEQIRALVEEVGGTGALQPGQLIMYNSLMGIDHTTYDDYGNPEKEFRLQWEKNSDRSQKTELKVTFNRADSVATGEVFEAIKSADQSLLAEVFANGGKVRVCARNGALLGFVGQDGYNGYLASDSGTLGDNGFKQTL